MSNPVDVKWFTSDMPGAPALSGTAGALIAVLDACLLNGFGSVTLTSLTVSSGIATAVKAGHGFLDHVVVRIEGATPSGLNGDKRITWLNANEFTFDATGISDQTATGTITAKMAPAGWTKLYSGTNKAAYARANIAATTMMLRVDDTPTYLPTLIMYESMTDVDTGTGPAPTTGSYYTAKSSVASSTARPWRVYADDYFVYFCVDQGGGNQWWAGFSFGDFISYKSGDAFNCLLCAHPTASSSGQPLHLFNASSGSLIARAYAQTGGAILSRRFSHLMTPSGIGYGSSGNAYLNPVDNSFHAWPVEIWEDNVNARGIMPGLWNPIHTSNTIANGTLIDNPLALPGRILLVQKLSNSYAAAIDITGPWR